MKNVSVLMLLVLNGFSLGLNQTDTVLSRKRRYLLFPEGSSLQLVYDFTVPISYSKTIFVFATTAALAWMLPSTIEEFKNGFFSKKFYKVPSNRIDTQKTKFTPLKSTYNTEFWHNEPYEKYSMGLNRPKVPNFMGFKPNFNFNNGYYNNFLKNSPSYQQSLRRKYYVLNNNPKINRVYNNKSYNRPITTYINPVYGHHHRRTRRDLFKKLEKFLNAQKKDGKSCVLKAICEINDEVANRKGTFTEEILKAVFRFGPSHNEENDIYDKATKNPMSCSELYPCDFSIWEVI
ncbi:uncharacterized protein [Onthophagus taurus]|uniref:uncharacterized protein n=1 Tax=Onthophagus taurus TaxID=166361 RepID=UPI0039BE5981